MSTVGPNYAAGYSDASGDWTNPSYATGSTTGNYATWVSSSRNGSATLQLNTFGLSVPAGSTINSVTLEINHRESNVSLFDQADLTLVINGIPSNTIAGTLSTSDHTDTLVVTSGVADTDIPNIALQFGCSRPNTPTESTEYVDWCRVTVDYTSGSGDASTSPSATNGPVSVPSPVITSVANADTSPAFVAASLSVPTPAITTTSPYVVTATQSVHTAPGMMLRVVVLNNAGDPGNHGTRNTYLRAPLTYAQTGSIGFVAANDSSTTTAASLYGSETTQWDAHYDSTNSSYRYTGRMTGLSADTNTHELGWNKNSDYCCGVTAEFEDDGQGTLEIDASSPADPTYTSTGTEISSEPINAPTGSLLVAIVCSEWTSSPEPTLTLSDNHGLTWYLKRRIAPGNLTGMAGIYYARVEIPPTIASPSAVTAGTEVPTPTITAEWESIQEATAIGTSTEISQPSIVAGNNVQVSPAAVVTSASVPSPTISVINALVVTATMSGPTDAGILMRVNVFTNAAEDQSNGDYGSRNTYLRAELVPVSAGSYAVVVASDANTTSTVGTYNANTTTWDAYYDSTNGSSWYCGHATSLISDPPPATLELGWNKNSSDCCGVVAEFEDDGTGTITRDSSSPAASRNETGTEVSSPAFSPPEGSLIVALVAADFVSGESIVMSDNYGLEWHTKRQVASGNLTSLAGVYWAWLPEPMITEPSTVTVTTDIPRPTIDANTTGAAVFASAIGTETTVPAVEAGTGNLVAPKAVTNRLVMVAGCVQAVMNPAVTAISSSMVIPVPDVVTSGSATAFPGVVVTDLTAASPSVSVGSMPVPSGVGTATVVPAPSVRIGTGCQPATAAATVQIPAISFTSAAQATPAGMTTGASIPVPSAVINCLVLPGEVVVTSVIPEATVLTTAVYSVSGYVGVGGSAAITGTWADLANAEGETTGDYTSWTA